MSTLVQRRDSQLRHSRVSPSLLLHFPFPEQRLQMLRLIKAKLSGLKAIPTIKVLLKDLEQDITDLEKLIHEPTQQGTGQQQITVSSGMNSRSVRPQPDSPSTTRAPDHDSRTAVAEQSQVPLRGREVPQFVQRGLDTSMSGALPAGNQTPGEDNPLLVRNRSSIEEMQHEGLRGHLIAASHHRDEEPKLSQIWRKGPRAFINDIIRREVGRRLREGEELRILDKDTVALLSEGLRTAPLQDEEDGPQDRGRLRRRKSPGPQEAGRARGRALQSPIQRTNSTVSSSTSPTETSPSPSTDIAVVEGPTSAHAIPHVPSSGPRPYRQSTRHLDDSRVGRIRYGSEPIQRTRDTRRANVDRPEHSISSLRRAAHDRLSRERAPATDARSQHSRMRSGVPRDAVRSTVASTVNLESWTGVAESEISELSGADDEEAGPEGGERRERPRVARKKVTEEQRQTFYGLGRRRT